MTETTTNPPGHDPLLRGARHLLKEARLRISHQREVDAITGDRFNLLEICGIGHYEVSTHSALISELLSPQGRHGQGKAFLECFLRHLNAWMSQTPTSGNWPTLEFQSENARVRTEVYLGEKTEDSGGRLDIFIVNGKGQKIGIENKIWAAEQDNWVRRYGKFLGTSGILIYLSPDGRAPGENAGKACCPVVPISHGKHIIPWLEECRRHVSTIPGVRESLSQYIHLIQGLTNMNPSEQLNEHLSTAVLEGAETYRAYDALLRAQAKINADIIKRLQEDILPAIKEPFSPLEGGNALFHITTPKLKEKNLSFAVEFERDGFQWLFYGIKVLDVKLATSVSYREPFQEIFGKCDGSTPHWPAWAWFNPKNWGSDEIASALDGKMAEAIKDLIPAFKRLANRITGEFEEACKGQVDA